MFRAEKSNILIPNFPFYSSEFLCMIEVKDDQNGPIHPENSRLKFFIVGGVRSNFRVDSPILF